MTKSKELFYCRGKGCGKAFESYNERQIHERYCSLGKIQINSTENSNF